MSFGQLIWRSDEENLFVSSVLPGVGKRLFLISLPGSSDSPVARFLFRDLL
jgi:hypothetical protein